MREKNSFRRETLDFLKICGRFPVPAVGVMRESSLTMGNCICGASIIPERARQLTRGSLHYGQEICVAFASRRR